MSPRRGLHREVYASVPTAGGKMVAIRSRTVAERLLGQQQLLQEQDERIRSLTQQGVEDRKTIVLLESRLATAQENSLDLLDMIERFAQQRLVRLLIVLRLVRLQERPKAHQVAGAPVAAPAP